MSCFLNFSCHFPGAALPAPALCPRLIGTMLIERILSCQIQDAQNDLKIYLYSPNTKHVCTYRRKSEERNGKY